MSLLLVSSLSVCRPNKVSSQDGKSVPLQEYVWVAGAAVLVAGLDDRPCVWLDHIEWVCPGMCVWDMSMS